MLRLPRLTLTNTPLMPGTGPTEMYRVLSPCGGSTLITSAPMSAMIWVQYGPITIAVRSTTRTPAIGPVGMVGLHGVARQPKLYRMCSLWPSGTTGNISGASTFRIASSCSPTSSTVHDGRHTPGLSAMTARATRPASAMNTSPVTEHDSCASQPTTGATSSGPIGG